MEHDDRHLDSFSSSMIEYFNEVLIHENCVSSTFRKYNVKHDEDFEFVFLLVRSACDHKSSFFQTDSPFLTRETVKITRDEIDVKDLTAYRLSLLKTAAENLLKAGGYILRDAEEDYWLHFTTKNSNQEAEIGPKLKVLSGPVVNSETKLKETRVTAEEYRKLRLRYLEATAENKNSDEQVLNLLATSNMAITLLQVKSNQAVSLNLNPDCKGSKELGGKGGTFLQYNASRIATLRKKYIQLVEEGVYLEIPRPEEIDFGALREAEEWALLFNFLLEYPSLINRVAGAMVAGKSEVHHICEFLLKLCSLFSIYYRRVRILLEPRDHLLQTIHARLLLSMSVEQVLENGLAIFNIKKIEHM